MIETARRPHAALAHEGAGGSREPAEAVRAPLHGSLRPPAPDATLLSIEFGPTGLAEVRRFVRAFAAGNALNAENSDALVLAVDELASNSVQYGGGGGTVHAWREADRLLLQVSDDGHVTEPLVGRLKPTATQKRGRGLWLVNQLCELVQLRSSPAGTVVRIHASAPHR